MNMVWGPRPAFAHPGDRITHVDLPDYDMTVHAVLPCSEHDNQGVPHNQYLIVNSRGQIEWLCGYKVKKAGL